MEQRPLPRAPHDPGRAAAGDRGTCGAAGGLLEPAKPTENRNLVDHLLDEVEHTPGALPLLSFTLYELYLSYPRSGRIDRTLSAEEYLALGGVACALRQRADALHDGLPDEARRATMRRLMLRLVSVESTEIARRRVNLVELDHGDAAENQRVTAVQQHRRPIGGGRRSARG